MCVCVCVCVCVSPASFFTYTQQRLPETITCVKRTWTDSHKRGFLQEKIKTLSGSKNLKYVT